MNSNLKTPPFVCIFTNLEMFFLHHKETHVQTDSEEPDIVKSTKAPRTPPTTLQSTPVAPPRRKKSKNLVSYTFQRFRCRNKDLW